MLPEFPRRQQEAIDLLTKGLSDKEISERMGIQPDTLKHMLGIIYLKTGMNRIQIAVENDRKARAAGA